MGLKEEQNAYKEAIDQYNVGASWKKQTTMPLTRLPYTKEKATIPGHHKQNNSPSEIGGMVKRDP